MLSVPSLQCWLALISNAMEDELYFNFQVDQDALRLLVKCVDRYLEKWPGGKPSEQEAVKNMLIELNKASLEFQFFEDGM